MTVGVRFLLAAAVGVSFLAGLALVVAAFQRPRPRRPRRQRVQGVSTINSTTVAASVAAGVVVLVITRWLAAALATMLLVAAWSSLFQSTAATRERRRIDAIAKWLEDLRDLQRGSNLDLLEAMERSATRAPKDIRGELARFADRVRHHTPIEDALLGLAADLDHPTADMAVASMLFAHGHASGSALHDTFAELARSARDEVTARDQVDRLRTRFETSMRRMLVILVVLVAYLMVVSPETLAEYDTAVGQLYLVIPIMIWGIALWWLRQLSRYQRTGRYLDYEAFVGARR